MSASLVCASCAVFAVATAIASSDCSLRVERLTAYSEYATVQTHLPNGSAMELVIRSDWALSVLKAAGSRGLPDLPVESGVPRRIAKQLVSEPIKIDRVLTQIKSDAPFLAKCGAGGFVATGLDGQLWKTTTRLDDIVSRYFRPIAETPNGKRYVLQDEFVGQLSCVDIAILLRQNVHLSTGRWDRGTPIVLTVIP